MIQPGATLGILGGGQLGRMVALAARSLGYQVRVLDPDPGCAARPVVEHVLAASFDDAAAYAELARHCDVVTLEIEKLSIAGLQAAARHCPVRPGFELLQIIQDKGRQKQWLRSRGFPVGPFHEATSAGELKSALEALGGACFIKSCKGGYDGRGQFESSGPAQADEAWSALGELPVVVEKALRLEAEISVMVARQPPRPGGDLSAGAQPPRGAGARLVALARPGRSADRAAARRGSGASWRSSSRSRGCWRSSCSWCAARAAPSYW